MSDEDQNLAEVDSAPAPEETTASEPAEQEVSGAQEQQEDSEPKEERKFSQEELDAALGKRLARERRKWEREQQSKQVAPQVPNELPAQDSFESPEHYADFIRAEAQKLVQQQNEWNQQAQIEEAFADRVEEAMDRYDDYDQVVSNPNLHITDVMAATIKASEKGPDVAYYLGTNPKEAARIAKLPPYTQAMELGKLEVKLAANPPVKKTSSAPEPIKPVASRNTSSGVVDTTDPRSTQNMSTSEWIAAERQRQIAKARAAQNR